MTVTVTATVTLTLTLNPSLTLTLILTLSLSLSLSLSLQMWKMLRVLAFAGVTGAVLMTLVDEKSLPKGLGFSSDMQPVAHS